MQAECKVLEWKKTDMDICISWLGPAEAMTSYLTNLLTRSWRELQVYGERERAKGPIRTCDSGKHGTNRLPWLE